MKRRGPPLADRAEHQHAAAERQLRVQDRAVRPRHDHVLLEAEHPAQPVDGGRRVAVPHPGDYRAWGIRHAGQCRRSLARRLVEM
jgi:hypothetical protein